MTLFLHEIKRGRLALIIWTAAIAFMLAVCVVIYPEMSAQMNELGDMFSDMGAFSEAFGMDQLNFGEFMGYFGIECSNTLGLGGALFAAVLGACALSKEEKDGTAELLLTYPISRTRVLSHKLLAIFAQIFALNFAVAAVSVLSMVIIAVDADAAQIALIFLAYFLMQIEIASLTFCLSAFMRGGAYGASIGIALALYFANIVSNLADELEFLKFVSPFGYADGSHIVGEGNIEIKYLIVGMCLSIAAVVGAYFKYRSKDIH